MNTKSKKKGEPGEWYLRTRVQCDECEGSGKVWILLRGANVQTMGTCPACLGFGSVVKTTKLSEAESKKIDGVLASHGAA